MVIIRSCTLSTGGDLGGSSCLRLYESVALFLNIEALCNRFICNASKSSGGNKYDNDIRV